MSKVEALMQSVQEKMTQKAELLDKLKRSVRIRQGYGFNNTASVTVKLFQRHGKVALTLSDGDKTVDTNLVEYAHVLGATLEEVMEIHNVDKHTWADRIAYPTVRIAEIIKN